MDDHDLLIRIDERMEKIEDMCTSTKELFQTHESDLQKLREEHDKRLRELEKNQSRIMTYILLIGSAITIGLNFFWEIYHKFWK